VTGGVGWIDRDVSAVIPGSCSNGCGFSKSDTKAGLAVGAGAEWAFYDRWSAKLEYLYLQTPTDNKIPDIRQCNGCDFENFNVSTNLHVIRVGLNYRFGGFGAPY